MILKRIFSFINWLGGPDRKNGKNIWRKGYWKNYGYKNQVWVKGTWIRKKQSRSTEHDENYFFIQEEREEDKRVIS